MKTILQNRWLLFSLRLILGVIFILASISKIQDIAKFVSIVTSYGMLPNSLANLYGNIVPWLELFIGCALLLGVFVPVIASKNSEGKYNISGHFEGGVDRNALQTCLEKAINNQ